MRYMGWSWHELDDTPEYVRRYSWDMMQARNAAENKAMEDAEGERRRA